MKKNVLVTLLVVVALLAGLVACQTAPTEEPAGIGGRTQVIRALIVENMSNLRGDTSIGGDLTVAGDTALAGGLTVVGALEVTGGITGTNVLTTGDQTITGIKTFTTPAALTGGITGPLVVTGPTAAATATPATVINNTGAANNSLEVRKNATPVAYVTNAGGVVAAFLTTAGALTSDSAVIGGGYGSTGCTLSTAGVLQCNGAMTTDGALTAASAVIGGGYGATGCTLSDAGVLQCNGAVTTDGALTAASAVIGGGYGATGCTLSAAGDLACDGGLVIEGNVAITGTLQYGALFPLGFASGGQQVVYGTSSITTTLAVPHGLTTVTFCQATLGQDPGTGAGDAAVVTVAVAGNVCTVKAWQDDFSAATETDVVVQWLVIGAP